MSITHEDARRLIQFKADGVLSGMDSNLLETHLNICLECQKYAASITELDSTLPSLLHRRWGQQPLPHYAGQVVSRKSVSLKQSALFATRIIAMTVLCITFLFNIWEFSQSGRQRANPPSAEIPMIPTPSAQSTVTYAKDQNCEAIVYQVQQNDTLERIAKQFSVPADEILRVNQLKTARLTQSMRLSIPVCSPTPSGTLNNSTRTSPPLFGTTTLTPMDSPTQ